MLQFDFENSVGCWIFAATRDLSQAMNDELAAHGITYRQWEVLALISFAGEMSQTELAERMSIEAPTLVGVLDRMERDEWIQRVPAENDRRKKIIRATERVEPLWSKMVECAHRVRARATQGMSPEQLAQLRDTLAAMRANLRSMPDDAGQATSNGGSEAKANCHAEGKRNGDSASKPNGHTQTSANGPSAVEPVG